MPLSWRNKILLAKIESTYGTDAVPTGAANAILATNVQLTPMEGSDVSRELDLPNFGAQPTVPAELHARLQFEVELAPSGAAGTAPAWGPLLRACACAETIDAGVSVTYNPVTSGHESVTIHLYIDSTLYTLVGARGTATFGYTAQAIPRITFDFMGLYVQPAEGSRPTPTLTGFQKPQIVTDTFTGMTLDSGNFVMRSASLNLGNAVEGRYLVGGEGIIITDRSEVFETTVEAVALTSFDPFQLALDQTDVEVELTHGTGAGRISTLTLPTAQMQRPQGLSNAQNVKEWPLRLVPQAAGGDDQWTLVLT